MPAKKRSTPKDIPAASAPAEKPARGVKPNKVAKSPVAAPPSAPVARAGKPPATPAKAKVERAATAKRPAKKLVKAEETPRQEVAAATHVETHAETHVETRVESPAAPAPTTPPRPAITVDDIRQAAFYLSQRRRGPSDPVADWLEAERLLLTRAG